MWLSVLALPLSVGILFCETPTVSLLNTAHAANAKPWQGTPVGVVQNLIGTFPVQRYGARPPSPMKVGDDIFGGDEFKVPADGRLELALTNGTSVILGEKSELVIGASAPNAKGEANVIELVSGLATVANTTSGKLTLFKMPVGTVTMSRARAFASYDPQSGDAAVINLPAANPAGANTPGALTLRLPNGETVGDAVSENSGWSWNAKRREKPEKVLNIVAPTLYP